MTKILDDILGAMEKDYELKIGVNEDADIMHIDKVDWSRFANVTASADTVPYYFNLQPSTLSIRLFIYSR